MFSGCRQTNRKIVHIDPIQGDVLIEKNFFSVDIPVSERTKAFNRYFFHYKNDWQVSFALMLVLSTGIATLGLSLNSSATIIGAMIIAPLGQPILALGGAIALGWKIQSLRMLGITIVGVCCALVMSYIIGLTLPDLTPNQQILIRTSPDLRDLGIAIFAGAAGAYGYYRSEFSTILAGVAIAVALITPLCCCGLMIEQKDFILAGGSFLLFVTNFIGITFSALLFFFILGIKHKRNQKWYYTGLFIIIAIGLTILFPLGINYQKFSSRAKFHSSVYMKAANVCSYSKNSPTIKKISIQGTAAIITIEPFPGSKEEEEKLRTELEETTGLQIFLTNSSD